MGPMPDTVAQLEDVAASQSGAEDGARGVVAAQLAGDVTVPDTSAQREARTDIQDGAKGVVAAKPGDVTVPVTVPDTAAQHEARTDIHWMKICLYVLKYSGLVLTPILLVHLPLWAVPRALTVSISSAQEFWDHCKRGDTSLEDPHYPVLNSLAKVVLSVAIIPCFWIMPNDALPAVHGKQDPMEYAEARRRLGKLWPRQIWGGIFAMLWVIGLVVFFFPMLGLMEHDAAYRNRTAIFSVGFAAGACGVAHQAYALDAAWANSRLKLIVGAICIFAYFFVCQMLAISAPRILAQHDDLGLLGLLLTANTIVAIAKQLTIRGGGDIGLLSFVSMGVGTAVGIGVRQYVFFKPSVLAVFVSSILSAGVTLTGHIGNFIIFKYMPIHPRSTEAHEAILFSDQVYEVISRVISMLVLTVTDTRFYTVGKTGFGEQVDTGMVMVNFVISLALHALVAAIGIKLMYNASSTINMAKFAESYKVWHAVLGFACIVTATLTMTINFCAACLYCVPEDHRDAYTCFDA